MRDACACSSRGRLSFAEVRVSSSSLTRRLDARCASLERCECPASSAYVDEWACWRDDSDALTGLLFLYTTERFELSPASRRDDDDLSSRVDGASRPLLLPTEVLDSAVVARDVVRAGAALDLVDATDSHARAARSTLLASPLSTLESRLLRSDRGEGGGEHLRGAVRRYKIRIIIISRITPERFVRVATITLFIIITMIIIIRIARSGCDVSINRLR